MRVVSLCPSLTELVFDLGRGDDLVGVTKFCVHPADKLGAIPKVGGTKDPDVERIAELEPDLVLLNEEENRVEDADALAAKGVVCHTSMPRTTAETASMVRSIGLALERPEEAERIALDIEERTERVRTAAQGTPRVSFAYVGEEGMGLRVRWWEFDHTDRRLDAGDVFSLNIDTQTVDLELFGQLQLNDRWSVELAAGLRPRPEPPPTRPVLRRPEPRLRYRSGSLPRQRSPAQMRDQSTQ